MSKQLDTRPLTDHVNLELLHLGMLQLGLSNNPLLPKFLASAELTLSESFTPLTQTKTPAKDTKLLLSKTKAIFDDMYLQGEDIQALLALKAWLVDQVLAALWQRFPFGEELS